MKRRITIFIIIFSLILSCNNNGGNNKENSFENENVENTQNKIIQVGIDIGFPPFGYLDKGNIADSITI